MRRGGYIVGIVSLCLVSCQNPGGKKPVEQTRFLMDTVVRVAVYEETLSKEKIGNAIDRAFQVMEEAEVRTSVYVDSSEVVRINDASGRRRVPILPETFSLLKQSVEVSVATGGAFDITVGAIKSAWHFEADHPHVPDASEIRSLLPRVNFRRILLGKDNVLLAERGMRIDMGGVAKGFVIDQGVGVLKGAGIRAGLIDAGGDLRIFGQHPYRDRWKIGIRHPRSHEGELIGVLETDASSIATSGDYERYFIQDGKRYHHILDPKTGYPAEGCISVTVVAESAVLADAYATAVFVLGPAEGMTLIEHRDDLEGLIVFEKENVLGTLVSSGLRDRVQFTEKIESRVAQ